MTNHTINVPTMFADHHVLKVRQVIMALEGVDDVYASSGWQTVIVTYEPSKIAPEAIESALSEAGYPPGKAPTVLAVQQGDHWKDSAWEVIGTRVTEPNSADLRIAG